jgi:Mn-dependent DtxR family transcriptional regulator
MKHEEKIAAIYSKTVRDFIKRIDGKKFISQITKECDMFPGTPYKALNKMKRMSLIDTKKEGRRVILSLTKTGEEIKKSLLWIEQMLKR